MHSLVWLILKCTESAVLNFKNIIQNGLFFKNSFFEIFDEV